MKLARLQPRVQPLDNRQAWQKSQVNPKRLTGNSLQKRNNRIKMRDQWTCRLCGRTTIHLEVDHIIPLSQGGGEDDSNLQSLCAGHGNCHDIKTRNENAFNTRGGGGVRQS